MVKILDLAKASTKIPANLVKVIPDKTWKIKTVLELEMKVVDVLAQSFIW